MRNNEQTFETAEALALTGIGRRQWDAMMQRQQYEAAPPVAAGHPRYFTRDDVVALFTLDSFIRLEMSLAMAGRIASAVRAELRKGGEKLETLWLVSTSSGTPHRVVSTEPPAHLQRYVIPVGELRRNIEQIAADRFEGPKPC